MERIFRSASILPGHTKRLRPRDAIEYAHIEGLKAIAELCEFEPEHRANLAVSETSLVTKLEFEVLLDIRDLVAECAWRLSDLAPHTVEPHARSEP